MNRTPSSPCDPASASHCCLFRLPPYHRHCYQYCYCLSALRRTQGRTDGKYGAAMRPGAISSTATFCFNVLATLYAIVLVICCCGRARCQPVRHGTGTVCIPLAVYIRPARPYMQYVPLYFSCIICYRAATATPGAVPQQPLAMPQRWRQLFVLPMLCTRRTALGAAPAALRGKIALGAVPVALGFLCFLTNFFFLVYGPPFRVLIRGK